LHSGDELLVQIERDREQLQILVADNGVGLPDNFSIEASTNLGLQIVKTLTENELRGTISLSPRASGGTDALLSIPLG
jgi:two-component sensor histidine kinase